MMKFFQIALKTSAFISIGTLGSIIRIKLFFAALRREAKNTIYKYRENVSKIRRSSLRQIELKLKVPEQPTVELEIGNEFKKINLNQVRKILLQDACAPPHALLKIFKSGGSRQERSHSIQNWSRISQLFQHPLIPHYGQSLLRNETDHVFKMNQTVQLLSEDGKEAFTHILWPQAIFSRSCRGIGVPPNTFQRLQESYGDKLPKFVNPSNKEIPLKVYQVDFELQGFQAIGLFPKYVESHKTVFKGLDLFAALTGSKLCGNGERRMMEEHFTTPGKREPVDLEGVEVESSSNNDLQVEGNIHNLDQWQRLAHRYERLWSKSSYYDTSCPEDVLRGLLFTRDITTAQLKEEFCKHFILFTVFSLAWRIDLKVAGLDLPAERESLEMPWRPWDLYIWGRSKEISALSVPATLQEFSDAKLKYDRFLIELFTYYSFVTAEMKATGESFFSHEEKSLPRAVAAGQILRRVLLNTYWTRTLYPNLHNYMVNHLKGVRELNQAEVPALSEDESQWHSIRRLLAIVQKILELEHRLFQDQLLESEDARVVPKGPMENWKIVILCQTRPDDEINRLIKFNTKISMQFVKSLDHVDNNLWFCQERKMIDPDTFLYLYQTTKSEPLSKGDQINNIITKLTKAK